MVVIVSALPVLDGVYVVDGYCPYVAFKHPPSAVLKVQVEQPTASPDAFFGTIFQ
jgi:hypothetical protein